MKNKLVIGLVVISILIVGGFITFQSQPNPISDNSDSSEKDKRPVLNGLGINIPEDFILSKDVLFDDGNIKNEKVLLEFGEFEHNTDNPDKNIEYWYFLKPKTKVRAITEGIVSLFFIKHTQDWGVNIHPKNSEYIVSFEHLINLEVEEGDIVKPGDIIGEAVPWSVSNKVSFTELSVWTGGRNIFKYCPFDFLSEELQPVYEQKINRLASDWENFIRKDVYQQENWVSPGCLIDKIQEK